MNFAKPATSADAVMSYWGCQPNYAANASGSRLGPVLPGTALTTLWRTGMAGYGWTRGMTVVIKPTLPIRGATPFEEM
jgi:hypothetical protein